MSDGDSQDMIADEVGAHLTRLQKLRREAFQQLIKNPDSDIIANKIQGIQKEIDLLLTVDSAD